MSDTRKPYPLRISLGFLVHDVARLRRTRLDAELRPLGITRAQRWMLIQLSQFGDAGVTQAQLAQAMHVGPVSLGEKLLLLEQLGYVSRVRGDVDRRQKRVRLTDEGYAALQQSTKRTNRFNRAVLKDVSPEDVAVAEHVLKAMRLQLLDMETDE